MRAVRIDAALRIDRGRIVGADGGVDPRDALELVDSLVGAGATGITLLDDTHGAGDMEGALALVRRIRSDRPTLRIAAGGGVGGLEDVGRLLQSGADRAVVGTAAIVNPELLRQAAQRFGRDTITVGMDIRLERRRGEETVDVGGDRNLLLETETTAGWYRVYVRGGSTATSRDAISWAAQCADMGIGELIVTSIDPSGEARHYDLELVGRIHEAAAADVLAAGPLPDARTVTHLLKLAGGSGIVLLDAAHRSATEIGELRRVVDELGFRVGADATRSDRVSAP